MIHTLSQFKAAKVLVIGDFMLDVYTYGKAARLSPEAPVPVLSVQYTENLPGGAGNVVLNLKALGAEVLPVGRVGDDASGALLKDFLSREGVETEGIFVEPNGQTPVKNRLIADAQQLARVDKEEITSLSAEVEKRVKSFVIEHQKTLEVIVISDYAKGFLSRSLLRFLIDTGRRLHLPVLVDPKGDDFEKYSKATLIKPNLKEAYAAAKVSLKTPLFKVGKKLLELSQAEKVLITLSEKGMVLFHPPEHPLELPAKGREVKDVTGAGDTVLAIVAMILAAKIKWKEGLYLANIAAGLAVEHIGCARISLSALTERLLDVHPVNKVFDEKHLFILEQALIDKQLTLLSLNAREGVSAHFLSKLRSIAKKDNRERLLLYIIDREVDEALLSLLSSLHEVDYIIVESNSLRALCKRVIPKRLFALEGEKLSLLPNFNHFLEVYTQAD